MGHRMAMMPEEWWAAAVNGVDSKDESIEGDDR